MEMMKAGVLAGPGRRNGHDREFHERYGRFFHEPGSAS